MSTAEFYPSWLAEVDGELPPLSFSLHIPSLHSLPPKACDRGMPQMCANATVSMTVADINDEAPQFQIPVYRVDIFDDTSVGVVLQPVATDQDSGSNAIIRYSIQVRLHGAHVLCGV